MAEVRTSIRGNAGGDWPVVDRTAYVDPSAQVIGNVRIGARVYVGPNAVIRADEADAAGKVQAIVIGDECNVQDGVIIHALGGTEVTVGRRTSLAHGCIVHGPCAIGANSFVGFGAVVYKATLGDDAFVNAGAVVQGVDLAAGAVVPPAIAVLTEHDAAKLNKTTPANREFMEKVVKANLALAKGYLG